MVNFRKWVLAVAIAIVLNLFVSYGIGVFYEAPRYDDFCREQARPYAYPAKPYPDQLYPMQNCSVIEVTDTIQGNCTEQKGYVAFRYNSTGCPTEAYCETCGARFTELNERRNSTVFIILVVVGVALIISGMALRKVAVASGFLLGGILSLIIGAIRIGGQLPDIFKLLVIGLVLALLIWVGYKKSALLGGDEDWYTPRGKK